MKLSITILAVLLITSCAAAPKIDTPKAAESVIIEKNKEIAALNEVGAIVRDAQAIEKVGRNMKSYRIYFDARSRSECSVVMEYNQRDVAALEARINKLTGDYKNKLTALIPDLNECVSCSKNAADACVKARASINQIIKEIYP